jgi:hypothetical protein
VVSRLASRERWSSVSRERSWLAISPDSRRCKSKTSLEALVNSPPHRFGRQLDVQVTGRNRSAVEDGVVDGAQGRGEGASAGGHLVRDGPERKDIGPRVERLSPHLFR